MKPTRTSSRDSGRNELEAIPKTACKRPVLLKAKLGVSKIFAGQGAKKVIFITTFLFTRDALEYTPRNETKIVLIDGEKLAQYMIDHNLAVTQHTVYELKRMDNDYFGEE